MQRWRRLHRVLPGRSGQEVLGLSASGRRCDSGPWACFGADERGIAARGRGDSHARRTGLWWRPTDIESSFWRGCHPALVEQVPCSDREEIGLSKRRRAVLLCAEMKEADAQLEAAVRTLCSYGARRVLLFGSYFDLLLSQHCAELERSGRALEECRSIQSFCGKHCS